MPMMTRAALCGGAALPLFVLTGACSLETSHAPTVQLMPVSPPAATER